MTEKNAELRSEIAAQMSLDQVRYSQVWEDHRVLTTGLAITEDDDVLSIASAGCNVLALLLAGARSVTAIDMSPAQIALTDLKLAAIRALGRDAFAGFFGARAPRDPRMKIYRSLRASLRPASAQFWDQRPELIDAGVLHCGRLDRYIRGFAREHLAEVWAPGLAESILDAPSLAEQRALFEAQGDSSAFRDRVRWFTSREVMASRGRDAAQLAYVGERDLGEAFVARFRRAFLEVPASDNPYLEYNLLGTYRDLERGPFYLRREAYAALRERVDRVELVTDELERYLAATPSGRFSKLNLSDVFEYMSAPASDAVFDLAADKLRAGGRLAYWSLLVPRAPSAHLRPRLQARQQLADTLHRGDRCWFYGSFHIEAVAS